MIASALANVNKLNHIESMFITLIIDHSIGTFIYLVILHFSFYTFFVVYLIFTNTAFTIHLNQFSGSLGSLQNICFCLPQV